MLATESMRQLSSSRTPDFDPPIRAIQRGSGCIREEKMLKISLHVSLYPGNALCPVSLVQRRSGNGFDVFGDFIQDAASRCFGQIVNASLFKSGKICVIGLLGYLSPDSPHISARDAPSGAFILP